MTIHRLVVLLKVEALTRERLWNGNTEPLTNLYRWEPAKNIIRWTWIRYPEYQERYSNAAADCENARLEFHRLRSMKEIDEFMSRPTR